MWDSSALTKSYRSEPFIFPMNSHPPPRRRGAEPGGAPPAKLDANMVIILAALLCALICALGINSIVRCFLRCARRRRSPRKGLKRAALRRIPVAVYAAGGGAGPTECPICLGEFLDGEKVRVLPECRHCFHVTCVDTWLAENSSCPTCRRSLTEERGGEAAGAAGHAGTPAEEVV